MYIQVCTWMYSYIPVYQQLKGTKLHFKAPTTERRRVSSKYILVYTCTYSYLFVQNILKKLHNCGIRTADLMHSIGVIQPLCYVRQHVCAFQEFRLVFEADLWHCAQCAGHVTWRLVSDIRRGPRSTPPAGHDIAGQGLHLDLPNAHVSLTALFGSGNVAPDCAPIEKQAATG